MADTYANFLGVYTAQFTHQWMAALDTASYPFRTEGTASKVNAALTDLSGLAAQADTLIAKIQSGSMSAQETKTEVGNLSTLISTHVESVSKALDGLEALDQKQLTKAAMLDHPVLRTLAAKVRDTADADLRKNLAAFASTVQSAMEAAQKDVSESAKPSASSGKETKTFEDAVAEALAALSQAEGDVPSSDLAHFRDMNGAATALGLVSEPPSTS